MQIHITQEGESIKDIAEKYGVCEENIRVNNALLDGEPAVGEELLVLIPTRTYTAKRGDSIDRISLRFGARKRDIMAMNPHLSGESINVGQTITLRSSERPYGMAVANGYFYNGCPKDKLERAMPYLTYLTVAGYAADERGIRKLFSDKSIVEAAKAANKIPLIRIFDGYAERYKDERARKSFGDELVDIAKTGGYKGIVLNSCKDRSLCEEYTSFILDMRKKMMGLDLILITEIDADSPLGYSEYADGSVMCYPKYAFDNPKSFDDGERRVLADFACHGESAKCFIDLPSLARSGEGYTAIAEALKKARRENKEIKNDENMLISSFNCGRDEWRYSSLKNIQGLLELAGEYDYSGVCFDIMRTPVSHLMMYNAMFKTAYHTRVRSPEGCSREA